jgi:hypothetical protein
MLGASPAENDAADGVTVTSRMSFGKFETNFDAS